MGGVLEVLGATVEVRRVEAPDAQVAVTAVDIRPENPGLAPVCVTLDEAEADRLVGLLRGGVGDDSSPAGEGRGSDDPASAVVVAAVGPAGEGPVPGVASCSSDAAPGTPSDWPARDDTVLTGFVSTGMGVKTVSLGGERRSTVMPVLTRRSGLPAVRVEMPVVVRGGIALEPRRALDLGLALIEAGTLANAARALPEWEEQARMWGWAR
ncbi:hypothetical protein [Actinomyces howellii]|uniref:Uncharacterized protein n=1 Tax=Actinomyces howellii TaxID=52771 RepID=A0A3S4T9R0_9ACTO|nr:hypothetical protein [Actinomyces howellii]VEG28008.1 Uncharacterised protein [Actinomyces howellii]